MKPQEILYLIGSCLSCNVLVRVITRCGAVCARPLQRPPLEYFALIRLFRPPLSPAIAPKRTIVVKEDKGRNVALVQSLINHKARP